MTGLIAGLISSWIFSLVAASARRKRRTGQYEAAAYFGTVALIYTGGAALGCIGIVAVVVIADMHGNPTATWPVYTMCSAVALTAIAAFYDGLVRRAEWEETTVRFSKWNGTRTVAWADIASLDIKPTLQYTRIGFRDGSGFAISELMTGYDSFVRAADHRGIDLSENGRRVRR
jgi:hypothetical protein